MSIGKFFKEQFLVWFGICGCILTILNGLDQVFKLADWVAYLVEQWDYFISMTLGRVLNLFGINMRPNGLNITFFSIFMITPVYRYLICLNIKQLQNFKSDMHLRFFGRSLTIIVLLSVLNMLQPLLMTSYAKFSPGICLILLFVAVIIFIFSIKKLIWSVSLIFIIGCLFYFLVYIRIAIYGDQVRIYPIDFYHAMYTFSNVTIFNLYIMVLVPIVSHIKYLSTILVGVILVLFLNELSKLGLKAFI